MAVTTACGSLNNLVVDRVEQGEACIQQLRVTNAGRASIMVLDKVNKGVTDAQMEKKQTPEGVLRLFDLIMPKDARFRKAFYKAVGETLVAADMEQATRIAFAGGGRRRVVTLQGQMIEANGTMGGGGKPMSGGMSSKLQAEAVRPSVLKNYEEESGRADEAQPLFLCQWELLESQNEKGEFLIRSMGLSWGLIGLDEVRLLTLTAPCL